MVEEPAETPVTKPVEFTVATAVFEDIHGFVALGVPPVPVNCVVPPTHLTKVPEMVGGVVMKTVTASFPPRISV